MAAAQRCMQFLHRRLAFGALRRPSPTSLMRSFFATGAPSVHAPPGEVLNSLRARGLLDALTHDARHMDAALSRPCTVYAGFDPTADSLHVGNLLIMVTLAHFQRHGHRPICLIGGATGLIGDPSGKSAERTLLSQADLERNVSGIRENLTRFLHYAATIDSDTGGDTPPPPPPSSSTTDSARADSSDTAAAVATAWQPLVVNNIDWHGRMSAIDFLRDIGKHFRLGVMLGKDSVKNRLEGDGLSFTEFSYQLLQASDFLHLYTQHACKVQLGGSDQWGNITAGCDLVRKRLGGAHEVFGATVPLLTTAGGEKFGKSAGNAVWLSAAKTSPYHVYQYFLNTPDADVARLLRLFTFLPLEVIEALCARHAAAPHLYEAQRTLAAYVTRLLHGRAGVNLAVRATNALFASGKSAAPVAAAVTSTAATSGSGGSSDGAAGLAAAGLSAQEWLGVFANLPTTSVARADLANGINVLDLAVQCRAFDNTLMASKMVKQGGLYLNNQRVTDGALKVTLDHMLEQSLCVLRTGKKSQFLVRVV